LLQKDTKHEQYKKKVKRFEFGVWRQTRLEGEDEGIRAMSTVAKRRTNVMTKRSSNEKGLGRTGREEGLTTVNQLIRGAN
jgi:hypothetical protein